jgi:proteasome lid subunit RPN8/RPN11
MDIPENISDIQKATGSMIGYIGEWHTHPNGHPSMSNTDLATAKGLKRNLDKVPMPTLIIIVTEKGLYPYIYPIK